MRVIFLCSLVLVVACGSPTPEPVRSKVNYTPTPPPAPFAPDAAPEDDAPPPPMDAPTGPTGPTATVTVPPGPPPALPSFSLAMVGGAWRQPAVELGSRESYTFNADGSYHRLTQSMGEGGVVDFETNEEGVFTLRESDRVLITDEPASAIRAYVSSYVSAQWFVPEAALPTTSLDGIKGSFRSYKRIEEYAGALGDNTTEVLYTFGDAGVVQILVTSTEEGAVSFVGTYGPAGDDVWAFVAKDARNRELQAFVSVVDGVALAVGAEPFAKAAAP